MTFFADQHAYRAAPAVPPAAHSPCPQLQAMDGRLADPSQYAPQYLLPFAAEHSHPGCAHFSAFFSAMTNLLAFVPPPGTGCNPQRCVVIHFQMVKKEGGQVESGANRRAIN